MRILVVVIVALILILCLASVVNGCGNHVKIPNATSEDCPVCRGSGRMTGPCAVCGGSGTRVSGVTQPVTCVSCGGSGSASIQCRSCSGTGKILRLEESRN